MNVKEVGKDVEIVRVAYRFMITMTKMQLMAESIQQIDFNRYEDAVEYVLRVSMRVSR